MPKELSRYLHQAIFNLHISDNVYVANYLVEPAIRHLEAILKLALKSNNIPIRKDGRDYDGFFVFKDVGTENTITRKISHNTIPGSY